MKKRLDPTNDYVFKRILCDDQAALISMINAVLQRDNPVVEATVLSSEILPADIQRRHIRLDVMAKLEDGTNIDIEMQSYLHPGFAQRLLYYFASLHSSELKRGQAYTELKPTCIVAWTKRSLFPDGELHHTFEFSDLRTRRALQQHCQIHVLQLDQLARAREESDTPLLRWAKFLANRTPGRYDDAVSEDPGIQSAMATLEKLSQDEQVRRYAEAREEALRLNYISHCASREEGREEGRQEGREEGRTEGVTSCLIQVLSSRFGDIPEETRQRIEAACEADIRAWFDRALHADTLEDAIPVS